MSVEHNHPTPSASSRPLSLLIIVYPQVMPRQGRGGEPNSNQFRNGLTYNAKVPAFLQALKNQVNGIAGGPSSRRDRDDRSASPVRHREGREPLPERPREGKWASTGEDEEERDEFGRVVRKEDKGEDDDEDEWDKRFGGGADDDGPQVVVVNEGKHISAEEFKKERNKAKGVDEGDGKAWTELVNDLQKPAPGSISTSPANQPPKPSNTFNTSAKPSTTGLSTTNKRKLVSTDQQAEPGPPKTAKQLKKDKKKEKEKKGLLSFGQEEEE